MKIEIDSKTWASGEVRRQLASVIADYIRAHEWSIRKASEEIGLPVPRVHGILNGDVEKISLEKLIDVTTRIGAKISFEIDRWEADPHLVKAQIDKDVPKVVIHGVLAFLKEDGKHIEGFRMITARQNPERREDEEGADYEVDFESNQGKGVLELFQQEGNSYLVHPYFVD